MQLSILVLATDRVAADALAGALKAPGHGVTIASRPAELLAAAHGYSLVIIDRVPSGTTVAAVV
ncbi:MAG: hypothetical protein MUQ32_12690, partial [Chloroflexi bacterium]|nr:hypothetical protein [Chloroflexota bacterium]